MTGLASAMVDHKPLGQVDLESHIRAGWAANGLSARGPADSNGGAVPSILGNGHASAVPSELEYRAVAWV